MDKLARARQIATEAALTSSGAEGLARMSLENLVGCRYQRRLRLAYLRRRDDGSAFMAAMAMIERRLVHQVETEIDRRVRRVEGALRGRDPVVAARAGEATALQEVEPVDDASYDDGDALASEDDDEEDEDVAPGGVRDAGDPEREAAFRALETESLEIARKGFLRSRYRTLLRNSSAYKTDDDWIQDIWAFAWFNARRNWPGPEAGETPEESLRRWLKVRTNYALEKASEKAHREIQHRSDADADLVADRPGDVESSPIQRRFPNTDAPAMLRESHEGIEELIADLPSPFDEVVRAWSRSQNPEVTRADYLEAQRIFAEHGQPLSASAIIKRLSELPAFKRWRKSVGHPGGKTRDYNPGKGKRDVSA